MLERVTKIRPTTASAGLGIKKTPTLVYLGHDNCYVRHDLGFVIFDDIVKNPTFVRNILPVTQKDIAALQVDIFTHDRFVGVFSAPQPTAIFGVDVTQAPSNFYLIDTQENIIKTRTKTLYSTPLIADRVAHFHSATLNATPSFFVRMLNALTLTWINPQYEDIVNPYHFLNPMLLQTPTTITTIPDNLAADLGISEITSEEPKILFTTREGTIYTFDGTNLVTVSGTITLDNFDSYGVPFSTYGQIPLETLGDLVGVISKGYFFPVRISNKLFSERVTTTEFVIALRREQRTILLTGEL